MTETLRQSAAEAARGAYAPYSNFAVGAAGRVRSGDVHTAANVENASYGLSLCAEASLCAVLVANGVHPGDLVEVVVTDPAGKHLSPCGRCRQLLHEFGGPSLTVNGVPMHVLLPGAFGPADMLGEDHGGH